MPLPRFRRTAPAAVLAAALLAGAGTADVAAQQAGPVGGVRDVVQPRQESSQERQATRAQRTERVGTFNILGSIHTRGGDRARTKRIARQLKKRGITLMGLQEVQPDQLRVLRKHMRGYRFVPGNVQEDQGFQLQVVWKRDQFDLVDHGFIRTPFRNTRRIAPWVRLRHEATGRIVQVINVHNPKNSQERNQDRALKREIKLYQRLRDRGGVVLLLGDMNDKREFFCKVTRRTDAASSKGGSTGRRCRPPARMSIDWLTGGGGVWWRGHQRDDVRTSDHPIHHAQLTLR
jgi:endonuclease/exonuclease/phosphatase family metal-dependent hydrolase